LDAGQIPDRDCSHVHLNGPSGSHHDEVRALATHSGHESQRLQRVAERLYCFNVEFFGASTHFSQSSLFGVRL
jgi:hypothetical protein